jgi:predicted glycogen debranching enzyme
MISFDDSICAELDASSSREWLETNGIGGFAASTISGMNRRRYHALLVAATKPPVGRIVLLSKLEETLVLGDGRRIELSTNAYQGAVHPQGFRLMTGFRLDPFPISTFKVEDVEIEKSIFMVQGENTTVVQYRIVKAPVGEQLRLEVRPLVAFRDYHSTTHANSVARGDIRLQPDLASVCLYDGMPTLHLAHNADRVDSEGVWYYNFDYAIERERGLDDREDLFNPLTFSFLLARTAPATIIASTQVHDASTASDLRTAELRRRVQVVAAAPVNDPLVQSLTTAADQFLARRGEDWTVMAGYPWFTDWGRDTMIALPGLTLFTGRADVARSVLVNFSKFVDRGMLPNRFPDAGEEPEFNTVDATLWYFEAIRQYVEATGDTGLARELYPALAGIIDWHIKGTRYGIRLLENGLLNAGEPGVQLTWMDAKVGDWVVTPRSGKPVEIQALWYNALKIMEDLAQQFGRPEDQKRYRTISSLLHWTFTRVFWNEKDNCLYDVVNGGAPDASIRPNQLLAVSLYHSMVPKDRAGAILKVVERDLLTPYGLRTLSPRDPNYRGRYAGDMRSRDSAYHQGTVWPWLLGPFISAYTKVHGRDKTVGVKVAGWLDDLRSHLAEAGLGQISEVFDGDTPHAPGGCFAQAWSVAEILRALCVDVYGVTTLKKPAKRTPAARRQSVRASSTTA